MVHEETTAEIIAGAYHVYNKMKFGFLESVYENCLAIELQKRGLKFEQQSPIQVYYDDVIGGNFVADLIVENEIIVELKSVKRLALAHEVQLVHYLTATRKTIGLLINFGERAVEVKRKHNNAILGRKT